MTPTDRTCSERRICRDASGRVAGAHRLLQPYLYTTQRRIPSPSQIARSLNMFTAGATVLLFLTLAVVSTMVDRVRYLIFSIPVSTASFTIG